MLELFQLEKCPYCKVVREKLAALGLDYIVRNFKDGGTNEDVLMKIGGKDQVPFLIDTSTGTAMYESDAIISYLEQRYGD